MPIYMLIIYIGFELTFEGGIKMHTNIDDYLCDLKNNPKLYLLCSPVGFGKHKLFMHISRLYIERKQGRPLIHTLELSEQQWKDEMSRYGFDATEVIVDESNPCTIEMIRENIEKHSPAIVMIHYLGLIDDEEAIPKLKQLSKETAVPIILSVDLARNCGDHDPMHRRPQLFDLLSIHYYQDKTVSEFRRDIDSNDISVMFLHRNHDCERGIGTAHRYNISNMSELMIDNNDFSGTHTIEFGL